MKLSTNLLRATALATLLTAWPIAVVAQPEPASEESKNEQAERLLHEAAALAKKNDWAGARKLLKQSFQLVPASETAANLGQAAYRLGDHAEAAEYFSFALRTLSPSIPAAKRKAIEKMRDAAKQEVGEVAVSVEPDGAEVSVDGRVVGKAPLPAPIYLSPGDHQLTATSHGYGDVGRIVTAKKGERTEVEVKLLWQGTSTAGTGGAPAGTGGAASGSGGATSGTGGDAGTGGGTDDGERSMVPVYVAGGVAVVGVAAAIGFELGRNSNADDASKLAQVLGPNGCGAGTSHAAECSQLHDSNVAANRDSNLRNVSVGIAGAGIVFGIAYLVWPRTSSAEPSAKRQTLTATPIVSSKSTGVWLSGSF